MTWTRLRPWLGTVLRLGLGAIWIWAAWRKIQQPREFLIAVRAYDASPEWLSKAIAYGLPVLELCLGVLLIVGIVVRLAATVSGVLFLVFLIAILQAWARGLQLTCGCFGGGGPVESGATYYLDVLRDVGLLAVAVFLIVWPFTRWSAEEYFRRHDYVEMPSAKRMRNATARQRYEHDVAVKQRDARIRERWLNASLAVVVVLVALIGIGVQAGRGKAPANVDTANATVANGVVFGKKAAATVDVYEDFQCPHCKDFEDATATSLDSLVRSNHAQVRYHMLSFLDASSNGNRYSSRAANAALCAADVSVDKFVAYHKLLFSKQPAEGSSGRTNAELIADGKTAGLTSTQLTNFTSCVTDEQHKGLVQAITDKASQDGVTGTPTVKVNSKSVNPTLSALTKAISAADAKGPKPSPSVTPTTSTAPSSSAKSSSAKSSAPKSSSSAAKSSSSAKSG